MIPKETETAYAIKPTTYFIQLFVVLLVQQFQQNWKLNYQFSVT